MTGHKRCQPAKPEPHDTDGVSAPWRLTGVTIVFASFFVMGYAWRDWWWGTHFVAFLTPAAVSFFVVAAAYFIFLFDPHQWRFLERVQQLTQDRKAASLVLTLAIAVLCAWLYSRMTIATDIYGDAIRNLKAVKDSAVSLPQHTLERLLSPNIVRRDTGEWFVLGLVRIITATARVSPEKAFGIFNGAFGFIFALAWVSFVHRRVHSMPLKMAMGLAGVLSGVAALFTNHAEVYAPAVAFPLVYLIVTVHVIEKRSRRSLLGLLALLLLCAKAHFAHHILWVPFALTAYYVYRGGDTDARRRDLTRKRIGLAVVLPFFAAVAFYYFVVARNAAAGRYVETGLRATRMFLPLVANEPAGVPRYTMFSPNHVFDYVNVLVQSAAPALFLIFAMWALFGTKRRFVAPSILVVEAVVVLYAGVFFAANPLLSMPRDWDLFSIPAPAFLVYAALLVGAVQEERPVSRWVTGATVAFVTLTAPMFIVNHRPDLVSQRLETVGVYAYRTYYYGSEYLLNRAVRLVSDDPGEEVRRRRAIVERIRPLKRMAKDTVFSNLTYNLGATLLERGDCAGARRYLDESLTARPSDSEVAYKLALSHLCLGEPEKAYGYADLLAAQYPEDEKYILLAFEAARATGRTGNARAFGERYLALRPDDAGFRKYFAEALSDSGKVDTGKAKSTR